MAKSDAPVETVAPRNDPKALEPYAKSQATKVSGARPGFTQHWFRKDQMEQKLRAHEIGNSHVGFLMVDGWTVVSRGAVTLERGMASAGTPTDTTVTNGELFLCETPDENFAKYAVIERKMDALIDGRLSGGETLNLGGNTKFKTRTAGGRAGLEASANDILNGAH